MTDAERDELGRIRARALRANRSPPAAGRQWLLARLDALMQEAGALAADLAATENVLGDRWEERGADFCAGWREAIAVTTAWLAHAGQGEEAHPYGKAFAAALDRRPLPGLQLAATREYRQGAQAAVRRLEK